VFMLMEPCRSVQLGVYRLIRVNKLNEDGGSKGSLACGMAGLVLRSQWWLVVGRRSSISGPLTHQTTHDPRHRTSSRSPRSGMGGRVARIGNRSTDLPRIFLDRPCLPAPPHPCICGGRPGDGVEITKRGGPVRGLHRLLLGTGQLSILAFDRGTKSQQKQIKTRHEPHDASFETSPGVIPRRGMQLCIEPPTYAPA